MVEAIAGVLGQQNGKQAMDEALTTCTAYLSNWILLGHICGFAKILQMAAGAAGRTAGRTEPFGGATSLRNLMEERGFAAGD